MRLQDDLGVGAWAGGAPLGDGLHRVAAAAVGAGNLRHPTEAALTQQLLHGVHVHAARAAAVALQQLHERARAARVRVRVRARVRERGGVVVVLVLVWVSVLV